MQEAKYKAELLALSKAAKAMVDERAKERQKEKQMESKVHDALDRYRNGTLTLDEAMESEWRSYVDVFSKEDPNNEDLAAFAEITNQMYDVNGYGASTYTINVGTHPARVYAAQWLCKQPRSLIITNVSSVNDLQTLLVSSVNSYGAVQFDLVRIPVTELPKAVRKQKNVCVIYNARESSVAIRLSANGRPQLIIESVADNNKKNEAQEKIQQLIQGFSENGDFELTLANETFESSLDLSIPGLRQVLIRGALFTHENIECLRKIFALKLERLSLERCNFESEEVKQAFFDFLVTLSSSVSLTDARLQDEYLALRKSYEADQALHKKALEYVKGMMTRVEVDESDLLYTEFSEINCKAILALKEQNSGLCDKPAFKKLFVIASVITKKLITISDNDTLQGVIWFLRNSHNPSQFVVNALQNEQYFLDLVHEMKNPECRACMRLVNLNVSAGAVAEYLKLGHASVSYFGQENVFTLVPLQAASSKSAVSVFNFRGEFALDTLQQCVEATKGKIEFSFSAHRFLPEHVAYLTSLSEETLGLVNFDDKCEFSPEAKACLFEKGGALMLRASPATAIHKEYVQYSVACAQRDRIKSLISRYKNNILTYSELMLAGVKHFIMAFDSGRQKELSAEERENLADLFQIVTFNREAKVVIEDDRTFRIMRWMLSHVDERLPGVHVRNAEEACALIAAHAQNNAQGSATIKLAVSDTHSMSINCTNEGSVKVSMKGAPQNAEVFNRIINSVSTKVWIELGNDQFLSDMDLSNPGIDTIMLTDSTDEKSKIIITAAHVEALSQTKQLTFFLASTCEFDSIKTQEAFVAAILSNERLVQLSLFDCKLTKKHLAEITAYAKSHPGLTEVTLGANAYREGEEGELMEVIRKNEARHTFIQNVKIPCSTFEETRKMLERNVDRLKDFYVEPACVAAYVEALTECVRKMSFSDRGLFVLEMVDLDKLMSRCEGLTAEDRQKVLDAMAANAVATQTLSNTVLVDLFERNHTNDALIECQRQRFEALGRKFNAEIKAKNFSAASACVMDMVVFVCPNSPVILFQRKYDAYLQLAGLYADPDCVTDNSDIVLGHLASIPVSEERLHELAQEGFRRVFCKKIREILLSDSKIDKSTSFQDAALRELEQMANNPKMVLQDVLNWMNTFIDDSSRLPFREKYITNRGDKVEKLEQLSRNMKPYIRPPIPSAPAKTAEDEKLVAAAALEKEQEHPQPAASVYPPAPVAFVVSPVEYPPVPLAQLADRQRARDAEPVLQGVAPAPASLGPQPEEAAAPVKQAPKKTAMLG